MPVYSCTITTITPLHIGDGGELRRDFDYVIKDKKTYRLNEDEIIKAKIKQIEEKLKRGECPPPGKLLNENDYSNPRLFRYVLNNVPRSDKPDARLKSCIKDCFDVPYIPGSSIKGALRTALAFEGWRKKNIILKEKIDKIPRNSKFPAESLEKEIFGENPNKDLLRSLHVSDFTPAENVNTEKIIRVVNMQVITQSKEGTPIEVEAIKNKTTFNGTIKVDDFLFSEAANQVLGFNDRREWITHFHEIVKEYSKSRLEKLIEWFEEVRNPEIDCKNILDFCHRLLNNSDNYILLQIGWGNGWDGMTFGDLLKEDAILFEKILKDFRIIPRNVRRKKGDPFPSSRRVVKKDFSEEINCPLGWVLLEIKDK